MNQSKRIIAVNLIMGALILGQLGVIGYAKAIDHRWSMLGMTQEEVVWISIEHDYSNVDTVLRDVAFLNETHGWIVGENGTGIKGGIILHTNNRGDTWDLQLYNATQSFQHIEVVDHTTIWTTGEGGLSYTENAGVTWKYVSITGISSDSTISTVEFYNRTYGWSAADGKIFSTADGGMNWLNEPSWPFDDDRPRRFHFTSETEIWCIGFYGIYQSLDRGETWTQRFNKGGWAFSFVNRQEAWAVADNMLAHLVDGETWMEQPLPRSPSGSAVDPPYFTDIQFLDADHGWIAGLETQIAYTNNGGIDWYQQKVSGSGIQRIMALEMMNATYGWATGTWGVILRTSTGANLGDLLEVRMPLTFLLSIFGLGIAAVVLTVGGIIVLHRIKRKQEMPEIQ